MTINEQKELGRGKNAVMTYMEEHLYVPKIYVEAEWDGQPVDVLAIDRDGAGDVHAALLFPRLYTEDGCLDLPAQERTLETLIEKFSTIPANYKYIVAVETMRQEHWKAIFRMPDTLAHKLFSADFIGRIGLLHVDAPDNGKPTVEVILRPERFRAKVAALADDYLQKHSADWEIRA